MKQLLSLIAFGTAILLTASPIKEMHIFPVDFQKGVFNIAENYPAPIRLQTTGAGGKLADLKAKLVVEVPEYVTLAGAAGEHPLLSVKKFSVKSSPAAGGTAIYTVDVTEEFFRKMVTPGGQWKNGIVLFLRAKSNSAGRSGTVKIRFEFFSGKIIGTEKRFSLGIYPALPKLRPTKQFRIGCTGFVAGWLPFPELFKEHTAFWKSLSLKPLTTVNDTMKFWPEENRRQLAENFEITLDLPGNMQESGFPVLEDIYGKKFPTKYCPLFALTDQTYWDKVFPEFVNRQLKRLPEITCLGNNYESFVEWGACRNCREDFARFAKLKTVPEGKELAGGKPLHSQWRNYRRQIRTRVFAKFASEAKKHFPELKFAVCSIPMEVADAHLDNWCGIDVRALDRYVDRFTGMFYFTGIKYFESVKYNAASLKAPQIPFIDPAEPYLRWFEIYTPEKVLQNLLATAALGGQGLYWYPEDIADARYMHLLIRGTNAIAQAENYFGTAQVNEKLKTEILNVNRIPVGSGDKRITIESPNLSRNFRAVMHQDKVRGSYAVSLFNFSSQKQLFVKIAIPEYSGSQARVSELISGKNLTGISGSMVCNGFIVQLEPDGCALLEITPDNSASSDGITQTQLRKDLQKELSSTRKNLQIYRSLQAGKSAVSWELFRKTPVIRLARNAHFILIDPADRGAIRSWGHQDNHLPNRDGSIDALFFTGLRVPQHYQFTPVKTGIEKNIPFVLMSYTVPADQQAGGDAAPLEKLVLTKRMELIDDQATIKTTYTFTNSNTRPMTLEFRIRNLPVHNWKPVPNPPMIQLAANGHKIDSGTTLIRKGFKLGFKDKAAEAPDDLTVQLDYSGARFTFESPDFAGLYFHCDPVAWTIEPLSPSITLQPGQSRKFTVTYRRTRKGAK